MNIQKTKSAYDTNNLEIYIIIAAISTVIALSIWANKQIAFTASLVGLSIAAILSILFSQNMIVKSIDDKKSDKQEQNLFRSNIKYKAEVWSFLALFSFIPIFFNSGQELDSMNNIARLEKITEINQKLIDLKYDRNYKLAEDKETERLREFAVEKTGEIIALISEGKGLEKDTSDKINRTSESVASLSNNMNDIAHASLVKIFDDLKYLVEPYPRLKIFIRLIPMLTLIFAAFSIARKLALAKWEKITAIKLAKDAKDAKDANELTQLQPAIVSKDESDSRSVDDASKGKFAILIAFGFIALVCSLTYISSKSES